MLRAVAFSALLSLALAAYSPTIVPVTGYTALKTSNASTFYQIDAPQSDYGIPVYLVDLKGSRYQMGYDYGFMLANEISTVYHLLLHSLLPLPIEEPLVLLVEAEMDYQWKNWLSVEVPSQYMEELQGITDGCAAAGVPEAGLYVTRAITVANLPGDLQDFIFILIRERNGKEAAAQFLANLMPHKINGMCSMWATWGNRSLNAELFSGRNLDWNQNTGINIYKAVTVFSPNDGAIPHAVTGYVGLWGALLGLSAEGLSVHEANLEENEITFSGFPWLLRLRYIMEYAHNTTQAKYMWETTNNTVGFNHMVASAPDAKAYVGGGGVGPGVAIAMETMFNYTAYFTDYDIRELDAMYYANATASGVPIGFPLHEALFRTNHGYDPTIRQHYEWSQSPDSWSMQRYVFMHDAIVAYQNSGTPIGLLQAANITSIAGDKGSDPYQCQTTPDGSNVLSVAFAASELIMAAAWENGNGTNWQPAACSSYLQIDLNPWFAPYLQSKA